MKNFLWISKLYFRLSFLELANYLMIGLPVIFLTVLYLTNNFLNIQMAYYEIPYYQAGGIMSIVIPMILCFQFFGSDGVAAALHEDLNGPVGARLKISGTDERVFYLAVIVANWLFFLLTGVVVLAIAHFVFSIYFASIPLTFLALALLSLMAQVIGVLIFQFTKNKKASGKIGYLLGEIMMAIAIFPTVFFSNSEFLKNTVSYLPVGLGERLVAATNFVQIMFPVGILLGIIGIITIVVFHIRTKKLTGV